MIRLFDNGAWNKFFFDNIEGSLRDIVLTGSPGSNLSVETTPQFYVKIFFPSSTHKIPEAPVLIKCNGTFTKLQNGKHCQKIPAFVRRTFSFCFDSIFPVFPEFSVVSSLQETLRPLFPSFRYRSVLIKLFRYRTLLCGGDDKKPPKPFSPTPPSPAPPPKKVRTTAYFAAAICYINYSGCNLHDTNR